MRTFYVRPQCDTGYGKGDGTSYEHAWNGLAAVDWSAMAGGEPTQLWVCGDPSGQPGFITVFVERSYLSLADRERELGNEVYAGDRLEQL